MGMFGYTVTTFTRLFHEMGSTTSSFRQNLDKVLEFMGDKDTPNELRQRVVRTNALALTTVLHTRAGLLTKGASQVEYMNFVHSSRFVTDADTQDTLELLSPTLRQEVVAAAYQRHLLTIPFIKHTAEVQFHPHIPCMIARCFLWGFLQGALGSSGSGNRHHGRLRQRAGAAHDVGRRGAG
jgi:hypothetical protein